MYLDLSLLLFDPSKATPIVDTTWPLAAVAHTMVPIADSGANGLYLRNGTLLWRALSVNGREVITIDTPACFDFQIGNAEQRKRTWTCRTEIAQHDHHLAGVALHTMLAVVHRDNGLSIYHYAHEGEAGALFLHLLDLPSTSLRDWHSWLGLAGAALAKARDIRPLLSDDCWYTRWRPDMELERKFTSSHIPDMWRLGVGFHHALRDGQIAHFVPELDRDMQTYDYESHIFEVSGNPREAGYIAFIPQADGLMAVKRKWFVKNDELRREDFSINHPIPFDEIADYARSMTVAPMRRLKPFRRTRIDVNCESLQTGNGFGIYFDICRMVDGSAEFAQIEVEYCRSRTFKPLHDIDSDFEQIATATHRFITAAGHHFVHDLYSKLDFVRDASPLAA